MFILWNRGAVFTSPEAFPALNFTRPDDVDGEGIDSSTTTPLNIPLI